MDDILDRFVAEAPVAVLVRASLAHMFADTTLDALFDRVAAAGYTRELTFSTLVKLLTKVVFTAQPSVHAAYRHTKDIPVSVTAVYDKLAGLETAVSAALVRETAAALQGVLGHLRPAPKEAIAGLRLRTLDGNFLAGTEHRLSDLRGCGAAALPGMSLVVRDGPSGLLTEVIPCEDAYTNERSLAEKVLPLVAADDLWLADRNFCTQDYLGGIAARGAFFLVRHHAGTHLQPQGAERYVGKNASGELYEVKVGLCGLVCRCIIVRLFKPLRDGTTELRLLTNVPGNQAGARRLAELYRTRWHIETAFQELTDNLRCEINTLGYPRAALFGFALAVAAYNLLVFVRQALAAGPSSPAVEEVSSYYLGNEVATVSEGLAIAVPVERWQRLAARTAMEFAAWVRGVVAGINWRTYRKSPRGPKKPVTVTRTQRGAHRSTARVLKQKGHKT
ncbi:MAG TPA: transposase [Acidimicrobiales bacterium]|nr:transposase [Acidimicrobiales bacterium]